jgi:CubicO group peptidase (beta-lactamase class C family)
MKRLKNVLKYLVMAILAFLILFTGYVVVNGDTYVFFLLKNTVFQGRLGPTIDDYVIFENRTVEIGEPVEWELSDDYNKTIFTEDELQYNESFGSAAYLVIKDGALLFEQYWGEYSDTSHTNSWSMAKSVISHLVGCALQDGLIESVQDPIGKYLEEYESSSATIENILTMSSGFNYYEDYLNPFSYPARSLYGSDIREVHKRYKQISEPGKSFNYQSANTQMLAFLLMKVTGKNLSEYASEKLWKPIGAEQEALWSLDHKDGVEKAFCCFNSNARDYAKFGYLYLNKAVVNGDTLVPRSYYEKCISPAGYLSDGDHANERYGYQWWTVKMDDENIFYARGIQGQYIFVLPESNLVIVRLGQSRSSLRTKGHPNDVYKYIQMGKRIAFSKK